MTDTNITASDAVEQIPCVFYVDGERKTENQPGIRVGKHFAFCAGPRTLVHVPSGQTMPWVKCWQLSAAKKLVERLEALDFVDWSQTDPTQQEISDEQHNILRAIASGRDPEVTNG